MNSKRQIIETQFSRTVVFFYCLLIYFLPISIALTETMAGFVIFFFIMKKIFLNVIDLKALQGEGRSVSWSQKWSVVASSFMPNQCFLNNYLGIFIIVTLVSVLQSKFFMVGLVAFVAKLLEGYFLFFSFVDCVTTRKRLRAFLGCYLLAVVLMGVNGFTQYITHKDFVRGTMMMNNRASSTFRHANDFGAYLLLILPVILGLAMLPFKKITVLKEWKDCAFGFSRPSKFFLFSLFLLLMICLGLTFSRSTWIGFWLSLLVFVFVRRKGFLTAAIISCIFLAAFLPFLIKVRDVSFVSDNVKFKREYGQIALTEENSKILNDTEKQRIKNSHYFGGMGRSVFWAEASSIVQKYPFFGSGLNTYSLMAKRGYPHNCYLQMAAETGVIGLIAFLALVFAAVYGSIKKYRQVKDPFIGALLAGAIAGFCGFLVQIFFDTTIYSVQLGNLMWIFMGVIIALPRLSAQDENTSSS